MKVGVLGSGQLSLLMAQANQGLDIELIPLGTYTCEKLSDFCEPLYRDRIDTESLKEFSDSVDIITYESENVSVALLESLKSPEKVRPGIESLKIFQNRLKEKSYFNKQGLETVNYLPVVDEESLATAASNIHFPAIIKTLENGFDGRGQKVVRSADELSAAWHDIGQDCIIEEFFDFDHEISIVAIRGTNKETCFYPVSENFHRDGQLRLSLVTGDHHLQAKAENAIKKVMDDLDYIGCMSMEFFVKGHQLVVNEVAPRVHNSGHWTIDGADQSQFLMHLKAIAGLEVSTPSFVKPVAMINLIGSIPDLSKYTAASDTTLNDYGKTPRDERKLGHVNVLGNQLPANVFYSKIAEILEALGETSAAKHILNRAES